MRYILSKNSLNLWCFFCDKSHLYWTGFQNESSPWETSNAVGVCSLWGGNWFVSIYIILTLKPFAPLRRSDARPMNVEALIKFRVNPCGIYGRQSGTGAGFSPSTSVFPCLSFHCCSMLIFIYVLFLRVNGTFEACEPSKQQFSFLNQAALCTIWTSKGLLSVVCWDNRQASAPSLYSLGCNHVHSATICPAPTPFQFTPFAAWGRAWNTCL